MKQAMRLVLISSMLLALSACTALQKQAVDSNDLLIYSARPLDSWHITVADSEAEQRLSGSSAVVPKPERPKAPGSKVSVTKSAKDASDDALTLQWKDTWYASLRVDGGKPLDLRPYIPEGALALDLNVKELAQGGLFFKIRCGENCERKVPYMLPARAMAGKGWQHLVFSMRCFVREGDDFSAVTQPFAIDGGGAGEVAVANVRFLQKGTPNAHCPDYKTVSVTPDMLNESWSISWWLPRHQNKLDEIKHMKANGIRSEVVFIGDSITQGWEKAGANVWDRYYKKHNALALGFGGDRTENVLWRLQHGEVDGIDPKVAVLMFGTNNTGHRHEDPAITAQGIRRNIQELQQRLPNTKILLLAIFPRDEKADGQLRQINERANAIISGFSDNEKIFFLNINNAFLDADGVLSKDIMPDLLHPNEKGYEIWAQAMEPELRRLLQQK